MKRLCIALLLVAVLMSGCAAGESGSSSKSSVSSTSSVTGEVELTQYTSESLGISFELDSKWVVDDTPLEPRLQVTWGNPNVTLELYIVEGFLDMQYYTESVVKNWLENINNSHYESPYTDEISDSVIQEISDFQSGYNQNKLDYISVRDKYNVRTQYTNGEVDSYLVQEMWGWVNLADDGVLVLHYCESDRSVFFDDLFCEIEELIDSVNYYGKPIDYYDPWGELVDPSFCNAEAA